MEHDVRVRLAHALREASGLGMRDVLDVMEDAEQNLDGDYILAALARHAHGFAINVRSDDPAVTPEQARRKWDMEWAESGRRTLDARLWGEVERIMAEIGTPQDTREAP